MGRGLVLFCLAAGFWITVCLNRTSAVIFKQKIGLSDPNKVRRNDVFMFFSDVEGSYAPAFTLPDVHTNTTIALVLPLQGVTGPVTEMPDVLFQIPLLNTFLPSFCRTASDGPRYVIYAGYPKEDAFYKVQENKIRFMEHFGVLTDGLDECANISIGIKLLPVDRSSWKYAWIQSKLLKKAYSEGVDFFYIVHDNTRFMTKGWTEAFMSTLFSYNPPLIGMVAPNTTYPKDPLTDIQVMPGVFIHRRHFDIFDKIYPTQLTSKISDSWLAHVYQPDRARIIRDIDVTYAPEFSLEVEGLVDSEYIREILSNEVMVTRMILRSWIKRNHDTETDVKENSEGLGKGAK